METEIQEKIAALNTKLTGDMMQDMDVQQEIFDLKRQLSEMESPTMRPPDSDFECIGCGS